VPTFSTQKSDFVLVQPRYVGGEPRMVTLADGKMLAALEHAAYRSIMSGRAGKEARARAKRLGLTGIVERRTEQTRRTRTGWRVRDLITGTDHWKMCTGKVSTRMPRSAKAR